MSKEVDEIIMDDPVDEVRSAEVEARKAALNAAKKAEEEAAAAKEAARKAEIEKRLEEMKRAEEEKRAKSLRKAEELRRAEEEQRIKAEKKLEADRERIAEAEKKLKEELAAERKNAAATSGEEDKADVEKPDSKATDVEAVSGKNADIEKSEESKADIGVADSTKADIGVADSKKTNIEKSDGKPVNVEAVGIKKTDTEKTDEKKAETEKSDSKKVEVEKLDNKKADAERTGSSKMLAGNHTEGSGSDKKISGTKKSSYQPGSGSKLDDVIHNVVGFVLKYKSFIMGAILFTMFVFMQMRYVYEIWFDPDELDIYTVAFEMFKGKVLYRDIPSQHMPFMYIISWIFYVFGARTAALQRLFFYMLFAGFWTSFVFVYKKYVNKWVFVLQPYLYYTILQNVDFGTQILSESLCVIGAEIFFLEFIVFLKKREISTGSCIRMCFATIFTFGTMFMAIFPLFFVGLGVLLTEIKWGYEDSVPIKDWFIYMLKKYGKLVGIVAIPWVIYAVYCLFTRSFHDMGFGVYTINTLYYPQYMAGLGGSTFGAFMAPFDFLIQEISDLDFQLLGIKYMLHYAMIFGSLYVPYKIFRKEGWIAGLSMFMYVYGFANRGMFNFHAKAFMGMMALVMSFGLVTYGGLGDKEKFDAKPVLVKLGVCAVLFLGVFSYLQWSEYFFSFIFRSEYNHYQTDTDIVAKITDEDERIWQTNVCDTVPWASKRVTTGPTVSTPWMWDAVGSHKIDKFLENPARVCIFYLGYESWNNQMADYAPEAYYYIVNNYKFIPGSTQVWVLNSYYDEACRKLGIDPETTPNDSGYSVTPYSVDESELPGHTYEDRQRELKEKEEGAEPADEAAAPEELEGATTEEATTEEPTTEKPATEEATTEESDSNKPGAIIGNDGDGTDSSSDGPGSSSNGPGSSSNGPGSSSNGPGSSSTAISPSGDEVIITDDFPGSNGTSTGTSTSVGPDGSVSNGPGDTYVTPVDNAGLYLDDEGNPITEDTPGAVQAPDGSWILPDDSAGPGSSTY